MGEGEPRITSPRRTLPGRQPLAPSHSPSPSPGRPNPTEMFSQSQSQRQHEQIPLGQHSDDDDDDDDNGGGGGGRAAEADGLVGGMGECRTSDRMRDDGDLCVGASIATESGRGESQDKVDKEDSSSRGSGSGRDGGASGILRNASTQRDASAGMLGAVSNEGGGEGAKISCSGGATDAVVPMAPLGDKRNVDVNALPRQGGLAAGPAEEASRTALCPGDVSGSPAQGSATTQPNPGTDAEQPDPTVADEKGRAGGAGGASLDANGARVNAPSSIWADLGGLASGDDSTSDDGEGATRSRLAASQRSEVPFQPQDPPSPNTAMLAGAAVGKTDRGATAVAGDITCDVTEHGDAGLGSVGDSHAAGKARRGAVGSGSAGFSLLAGAGGSLGDNELLDAALEDSD